MREYEEIGLRDWKQEDLPLLMKLMGDPVMMAHLGGPETPDQIRARHARYLASARTGGGPMFVITLGSSMEPAGSIGYWPREWQGRQVFETGWSVLPEYQGRGIATRALRLLIERVRAEEGAVSLHAFPAVHNEPSNAVCRKAGFTLQGQADFAYPPGHWMRCNEWKYELG
jgi:RimJ/RimL family protein N-acetyltransferase